MQKIFCRFWCEKCCQVGYHTIMWKSLSENGVNYYSAVDAFLQINNTATVHCWETGHDPGYPSYLALSFNRSTGWHGQWSGLCTRVAYYNEILHITMARLLQMLTHVRSSHSVQVVRSAHHAPSTMGPVTTHTRGDLTHDLSLIILSNPRCSRIHLTP